MICLKWKTRWSPRRRIPWIHYPQQRRRNQWIPGPSQSTCLEDFDKEIAKLGFSGENQVLRFVVPMKGRSGAHFLPAFQEVVAECNRLGYPVKVAHTDRAREAVSRAATEWMQAHLIQPSFTQGDDPKANGLAERLVGWLHLAAAGLGYEHWPTAMALACAEHRHRVLQLPGKVHQYGQRVVFKSKHPTGESKKPFLRWEYATYLTPCPRTDMGHLLLRESTGAYLVARNVRPLSKIREGSGVGIRTNGSSATGKRGLQPGVL